jgi:CubicO group peptidase (beta-lactamase class C family)
VLDPDLLTTVEALAPVAMREASIPGLALSLVTSRGDLWSRAHGIADTSTGRVVDPSTPFEAASLTKPVVALTVLSLAHDRVLDLDRPLDTYLAAPFLPAEPRAGAITARMALGHTTGFPNWRPRGNAGDSAQPLALLRDPGTRFGYSGEGYVFLQRVAERVTGTPLHQLCAERVLAPLGMADSTLVWRDDLETRVARGHNNSGAPVPKDKPARANAASSLHTTAPDLGRLVAAMLGAPPPLASAAGTSAIVAGLTGSMLHPHAALHGSLSWGLGWGLQLGADGAAAGTHFWHWGDNYGYKAFAAGSRSHGLGIAVLTNGNAGLAAAERLVRAVLPSLDAPFDALREFTRYVS